MSRVPSDLDESGADLNRSASRTIPGCLSLILSWLLAACASPGIDAKTQEILDELERRFSVNIVVSSVDSELAEMEFKIRASDPSASALRTYAPWLRERLEPYPDAAFACAEVAQLIIVSGLRLPGARVRGYRALTTGGARRAAVPASREQALIYDLSYSTDDKYNQSVFHHEYFHMLDAARDSKYWIDEEWTELNPPDFSYGSGGAHTSRFVNYGIADESVTGFVTLYATTAVAEDKAEIFEFLMTSPDVIRQRSSVDPVVAAKAALVRARLDESCPGFELPPP